MRDTTPEMEEKMREMMRMKTPMERLAMGASMFDFSKSLVIRSILEKQPDISRSALRQQLFLIFYGHDFDPIETQAILAHFARLG